MGKTKTVIELNGKQYDALTGKVLHHTPPVSHSHQPSSKTALTGGHVDGFFRSPKHANPSSPRKSSSRLTKSVKAHRPERAQTLMRQAVTKPWGSLASISAISTVSNAGSSVLVGPVLTPVKRERLERAHTIHQNRLISRFSKPASKLLRRHTDMAVQGAPLDVQPPKRVHKVAHDPIMAALATATSHEQPSPKKLTLRHRLARKLGVSTRVLTVGVVLVIAVLGGGWLAYQNIPRVTLKIASARAGFTANLPDYHPSGFALRGPIQYTPGQVTITYHSTLDTRQYQVVQQPSKWNSETLLHNVASTHQPYQTYENNGKTVYISDGQATFLNGQVQTIIKGSTLTGDQLAKIADSL